MTYIGDFLASGSADHLFTTLATTGAASALSGGSVVVYKNNGTVESSAGVTLTADFDGRTGLNHVGINLAADGSFYSAGANFNVVLAAGTANSVSLNGYKLCSFSIENRNQKPTGGTVNAVGSVTGNVGGSVSGGVLTAGSVTSPITVYAGTVNAVGSVTGNIGGSVTGGVGTVASPLSVYAGTVNVAGTISNPISVYAGTVNAAGTVSNPLSVYAGTVNVAGTVSSPILIRGGTVGTVTSPISGLTEAGWQGYADFDHTNGDYQPGQIGYFFANTPDDPAEAIIKKNVAYNNFTFMMFDTAGDPATGKTVTATRSIDGGAFAACANSVSEISAGWYKINLAAADLNGDNIALKFTATGCAPTNYSILPES